MQKKSHLTKYDIIIFFIVIVVFGLSLLAFYPGLMTSDVLDQLHQYNSKYYYDSHPVFHSFIIGFLFNIFNSTAAVAIFQIFVFAILWTYACKILREKNVTIFNITFQIMMTMIVCIIPVNFLYAITLWKDILYTYAILGSIIYIYIGIKNKFNYTFLQMILMSICLVLVMKIRHNGYPIGLFLFIIILILNIIKNKKIFKSFFFISTFIIILVITYIPQWCLNVEKKASVSGTLTSTKIYCMGALLNQDLQLEESEYDFLNNVLPIDNWKNNYDLYTGGKILFNSELDINYLNENINIFNDIFSKYAKMYPKTILKHFIEVNSMFWSVPERGYMHCLITTNNDLMSSTIWKDEYTTSPISEGLHSNLFKITEITLNNKILYTLLYRPATLMYLSIILVFYMIFKTKNWTYILLIFPMGLNIATYIPFTSSQDLRYAYPNFVTCYFLLLVTANYIFRQSNIRKQLKLKDIKGNKTLTIIPAYNESQNIQKVIDELKTDFVETDILVINDSSTDNTKEIVVSNSVNCITTIFNLNYAYAVQTGIKYAKKYDYDYCLMFDGDGQHIAKEAKKLLEKIKETNCDIVIGSRYLEKGNYNAPKLRKIGTSFFTWLIKVSCHTKISDPLSGFQVINKRVINKYSKIGEYPEFPDANLIIEMLLDGYSIEEVSVKMRNREFGESMHGGIIKPIKYMIVMLYTIILLILNKIFGRRR
ncbi:MAG: glycosyltransferase family 2 protein [Clostridia bacterium]|nr:glycosyltransferase family 2 protein [Clostridia bacterium]